MDKVIGMYIGILFNDGCAVESPGLPLHALLPDHSFELSEVLLNSLGGANERGCRMIHHELFQS